MHLDQFGQLPGPDDLDDGLLALGAQTGGDYGAVVDARRRTLRTEKGVEGVYSEICGWVWMGLPFECTHRRRRNPQSQNQTHRCRKTPPARPYSLDVVCPVVFRPVFVVSLKFKVTRDGTRF